MSAVALALFCPWLYACHSSVAKRYLFKKSRLARPRKRWLYKK